MLSQSIKFYIIFLLVLFLSIISACNNKTDLPLAKKGVIDLRNYNFENNGVVRLDGDWEFYWNKFLSSKDKFPEDNLDYADLPMLWNNFNNGERHLPGFGYATFRTKVLLPYSADQKKKMAIYVKFMSSAYNLFVDGKLICSNGVAGKNRKHYIPQRKPVIGELDSKPEIDLILQVANYSHKKGGTWQSIYLGNEQDIRNMREKNLFLEFFILGVIIIMSLYHFSLFLIRRDDRSSLYFGLFSAIIAIRTAVTGEYILTSIFPNVSWGVVVGLDFFTIHLAVSFFILYVGNVFKKERINLISRICIYAGFIFAAITALTPAIVYSNIIQFFQIIIFMGGLYTIYITVRAIINRRDGSIVFLIGFFALFLGSIIDILHDNQIIQLGDVMPYGLFIFIFSQSFLLSSRFSKAFKTIEEMSNRLVALDKLKDEFLANTSHELRTPLNGIIGIAESLIHGAAGPLNSKSKENLNMIVSSGRRLFSLVNDILDFSKLKNSDISFLLKKIDVRQSADIVIRLLNLVYEKKNLKVKNIIPLEFPFLYADEDRLQQIFHNLIGNAVKFTDSGEIVISAEVIKIEDIEVAEITVEDSGIGIPENKLEDIFRSFEQVDGSANRSYAGTGLGLSITKKLIELQDGAIRVESENYKGSRFIFTLPIAGINQVADYTEQKMDNSIDDKNSLENIISSYSEVSPLEVKEGGDLTVLAVDDDYVNLNVLVNNLTMAGYTVVTAESGSIALEKLLEKKPDVVLMDIMMPRMNGYETTAKIREKHSSEDLPVIFLTAKNQGTDLVNGFTSGGNDYITKPFSREELLTRIDFHIKLKNATDRSKKLSLLEQELKIAKDIQMNILPDEFPLIDAINVSIKYLPAESVGGDFYDFTVFDPARIAFFICDATGHGVPAALMASMMKIIFHVLCNEKENPDSIVHSMNQILFGKLNYNFVTANYLYIDIDEMIIKNTSAGHVPFLIYRRNNKKLYQYNANGKFLGIIEDSEYTMDEILIEHGDRLVLYTDGITEAFFKTADRKSMSEDDMFEGKFIRLIEEKINLSPNDFADLVIDELNDWTGKNLSFEDDVTLIVIDIN